MADAAAVVREYLQGKAGRNENDRARQVARAAAGEVIAELPDGFTARDARACVAKLLEGNPDTSEMSTNARGRAVTQVLDGMVSDGKLALDGKEYRRAAGEESPQVPVGL